MNRGPSNAGMGDAEQGRPTDPSREKLTGDIVIGGDCKANRSGPQRGDTSNSRPKERREEMKNTAGLGDAKVQF